jgi:hypothetical protein
MKKGRMLLVIITGFILSTSTNANAIKIGTANSPYLYGGPFNLIYEPNSPFGPITWLDCTFYASEFSWLDHWQGQVIGPKGLFGS